MSKQRTVWRMCSCCGAEERAAVVEGLGRVMMWELTCPECGASLSGFLREDECDAGEVCKVCD